MQPTWRRATWYHVSCAVSMLLLNKRVQRQRRNKSQYWIPPVLYLAPIQHDGEDRVSSGRTSRRALWTLLLVHKKCKGISASLQWHDEKRGVTRQLPSYQTRRWLWNTLRDTIWICSWMTNRQDSETEQNVPLSCLARHFVDLSQNCVSCSGSKWCRVCLSFLSEIQFISKVINLINYTGGEIQQNIWGRLRRLRG